MPLKKMSEVERYRKNIKKINPKHRKSNFLSYANLVDIDIDPRSSFSFKRVETGVSNF